MNFLRRVWAEIDLGALKNNFNVIKSRSSGKIMAVVKADAYGHGVDIIVPELIKLGADGFAVSNLSEAIQLRDMGVKKPVLILGYTPCENAEALYKYDIIQSVFSYEYAEGLSSAAMSAKAEIKTYIKIDTGMGRLGFNCRDNALSEIDLAISAARLPCLKTVGVFTHFADADRNKQTDDGFTKAQYDRFMTAVDRFNKSGVEAEYSCCNSAAIMQDEYMNKGGVCRPGIILYGLEPDSSLFFPELIPVMTVKSVVSFVKEIKRGDTVSYGRTFTAKKDMKVATVSAGYADGYPRSLSNKAYLLVNGKKADIIGRVCMDQMMIDVSDIDVKAGDEVILFGRELPVTRLADTAGTINYEIVCNVNKRVPRIAVKK